MTIAQRRNRLTTHFSESTVVVKRRIAVLPSVFQDIQTVTIVSLNKQSWGKIAGTEGRVCLYVSSRCSVVVVVNLITVVTIRTIRLDVKSCVFYSRSVFVCFLQFSQ